MVGEFFGYEGRGVVIGLILNEGGGYHGEEGDDKECGGDEEEAGALIEGWGEVVGGGGLLVVGGGEGEGFGEEDGGDAVAGADDFYVAGTGGDDEGISLGGGGVIGAEVAEFLDDERGVSEAYAAFVDFVDVAVFVFEYIIEGDAELVEEFFAKAHCVLEGVFFCDFGEESDEDTDGSFAGGGVFSGGEFTGELAEVSEGRQFLVGGIDSVGCGFFGWVGGWG